jgi:2'-5' RNA ligase
VSFFFAAWPPPQSAAALHEWSKALHGRPTPPEKIHLTLAFLGEADPEKAAAAARAVHGRRHDLLFDEARYVKRNEMIWAVPREAPIELVGSLHASLAKAGFVLESRPFAAHVTLLRNARRPDSLPPLPRIDWPVNEFLLVHSQRSTYERVARFALSA